MKLIFIYGPMGVGKFTTAKALSELTGYKLFHNHLTVDVVDAVFPEHGLIRSSLLQKLRFIMLEVAAKYDRDTIFTLGYSGALDDVQVAKIIRAVEGYGGEICFVQLYAPMEVLLKRIGNKSRQDMKKQTDPERMQKIVIERHMYEAVKHPNNLKLDNSTTKPEDTAEKIAKYYKLARINHKVLK